MATRIRYTAEIKQGMIGFYKDKPEATIEEAQEHAKTLGSALSMNMHNQLRREARGPAELPKEHIVNVETGRLLKNLNSAKGGERVAIYELKRRARVQISIVDEK